MNKKRYQNLFSSLGRRIVLALSLALGLFLAPNIQAQIKQSKVPIERTILGCTLGVSTPKQVVEIVPKTRWRDHPKLLFPSACTIHRDLHSYGAYV